MLTFLSLKNHSSAVWVIKILRTSRADIGDIGRSSRQRSGALGAVPRHRTGREGRGGGAHGPLALGFSLGSTGSTRERKRLVVLLPWLASGEERDLGRDTALQKVRSRDKAAPRLM